MRTILRDPVPVAIFLLATQTTGQTAWLPHIAPGMPPVRTQHGMANDPMSGRSILFGGVDTVLLQDTWEWSGGVWQLRAVGAGGPPPRIEPKLVHDGARGVTVMFGGLGQSAALNDTWEWNGTQWSQPMPPVRPPARWEHAVAYDAARQRVVLFGGWTGPGMLDDSWEWNGQTWTQVLASASPPARRFHAMEYVPGQGVLLFGGQDSSFTVLNDTWCWDGTNWQSLMPATVPTARTDHAMVFDPYRQRLVMFGGQSAAPAPLSDTWEWDGTDWIQRVTATPPPPRWNHAMGFDAATRQVLVFGGQVGPVHLGDDWRYGTLQPADFSPFGAGCAGTAGVPQVSTAFGAGPWIGSRFPIQIDQLPVGGVSFLFVGSSNLAWGPVPLPWNLVLLGMPGCTLYLSGDLLLAIANGQGSTQVGISLCNCPPLVGGQFFVQAMALDAQANAFGAVWSAAGSATIGAR